MGRIIKKINLDWKFYRGEEEKAWYKGFDDSEWRKVTLPHDWSVEEPFSMEYSSGTGYLSGGIGWYRKHFKLPKELSGKKVFITFEGVYNNSQVWCNSYYIGKRPYGYSTFTYDITDFVVFGEDNVISVKVNHKHIADSRWFTGSGIYRDVYITVTDKLHIDSHGVFATTPQVSKEEANLAIKIKLINEGENSTTIEIRNSLFDEDGYLVSTENVAYETGTVQKAELEQHISVKKPELWSPASPYLYQLVTQIIKGDQTVDEVKTKVGIRWFLFDADKGFFLNGVNMKIKGVCIHHDAGCLGAAVPEKVWIRRLKALKEMGCNAIRMSHNPPAVNLLDLCDSMGFMVMDEAFDEWEGVKNKWSTGHNVYPPKHFGYYEDFPEWGERDIKDMILRDRNHASIILWSIGNEVDYPNDPYCHPSFQSMTGNNDANKPAEEKQYDPNKPNAERLATIAKRLVKYVKECDTTRPVTAALAFPELSNLTGYAAALDVVGYNYKEQFYQQDHQKYGGRVIYGSENSPSLDAWLAVKNNDYICAQFIWTGIDYLGEARGWPVRLSQAGFMDVAGFKKTRYYYRKSLWNDEPMVYLSVISKQDEGYEDRRNWHIGDSHWDWKAGELVEVLCYTNCQEAELFLNNKSLGIKRLDASDEFYLCWETTFEEGILKVVTKNSDGQRYIYELNSAAEPKKLTLSTETDTLQADGQDITHVEIRVEDKNGRHVHFAENEVKLSIKGNGEIIGLENGNAQDLEPYNSKKRRLSGGKLLTYVRSKTSTGPIIIKAEADGLISAELVINSI